MTTPVVGLPTVSDLTSEIEILQDFMHRYGFDTNPIRIGVVEGKFSFLSGEDARDPCESGYWSEVATLSADSSSEEIRNLAIKLSAEVSDSYALQTSSWGQGTGVFVISTERLRMAN